MNFISARIDQLRPTKALGPNESRLGAVLIDVAEEVRAGK